MTRQSQTRETDAQVVIRIRVDARPFVRAIKSVEARVSNLDKFEA